LASRTDAWRRLRRLALLTGLLLAVPPPPASAEATPLPGSTISQGAWEGGAVVNKQGAFSACFILAKVGDYLVGFDLYADAGLGMYFAKQGWKVTPGSESPLVLRVDEAASRRVVATGLESSYFMDLGRDPAFLAAMAAGRTLYVVASGATIPLDLAGSGAQAALRALERCLVSHAGLDAAGRPAKGPDPAQGAGGNPIEGGGGSQGVERNPFAPPGTSAPAPSGGAAGDDFDLLRQALVAAGYPEPEFREVEGGAVLWTSKRTNIVGGFAVEPLRGTVHDLVRDSIWRLGPQCGADSQLLYDKIGRNSLGEVYSGRVDCAGGQVFFATFESEKGIAVFVHIVPSYEDALGQQINANLRRYLLSF